MDRLSADLSGLQDPQAGVGAIVSDTEHDAAAMLKQAQRHLAIPDGLFTLNELDVLYSEGEEALWTYMRPAGRPSFTPAMLGDFDNWQRMISAHFGSGRVPLKYLVLGSRAPGIFCFGGDLELFASLIREGNRDALATYGYRCVEILHRNMHGLDLPLITIGMVQGQALGGGFEALLSFDYIIAERGSSFGLPEVMFGLFPGMGAHAILSRRLGQAVADRIIMGNEIYSAEAMYELGIVHHLAEPGGGEVAVRDFMAKSSRRHAGLVGARRASRRVNAVSLGELRDIVDHWADAAIQLREQDLKLMQRLAGAQSRLPRVAA